MAHLNQLTDEEIKRIDEVFFNAVTANLSAIEVCRWKRIRGAGCTCGNRCSVKDK